MTPRSWWLLFALGCSLPDFTVADPPHFSLVATPAFIVVDPGDPQVTVTITASRSTTFTDAIDVVVSGIGVATQPAPIAVGATTTSFAVELANGTYPPDVTLDVNGVSGALSANTVVRLHVGSLLVPKNGVVSVPPEARGIVVKAW